MAARELVSRKHYKDTVDRYRIVAAHRTARTGQRHTIIDLMDEPLRDALADLEAEEGIK